MSRRATSRRWINEELPSVLESSDRTWVKKALAQTIEVFTLEDLSEGFDHLNGAEARVAYAESAVAAEILCESLGPIWASSSSWWAVVTRRTRPSAR